MTMKKGKRHDKKMNENKKGEGLVLKMFSKV
jgi:hypothetical protein